MSIREHLKTLPGQYGYAALNLNTGRLLSANERPFFAASTIKLPIMLYYFVQWEKGVLPETPYTYQIQDYVEDSPFFDTLTPGQTVDWREILRAMMIVSDNTATNIIIELLGLAAIQAWIQSLGFSQTKLQRKMVDLTARAQGIDNWTSPLEMLRWMQRTVQSQFPISTLNSAQSLEILAQSQDLEKIPYFFKPPIQVLNKPGELPENRSDIAYLFDQKHQVIMSIFCDHLAENDLLAADVWMAKLAQLLWFELTIY